MKLSRSKKWPRRGATMLAVLMFSIVGGIALTSWVALLGARLQQAEHTTDSVRRHISWGNSLAVNQQYGFQYCFQDNVSRAASEAQLNSWGGTAQGAISGLQALRSTKTSSVPASYSYPFNNLRATSTSDGSVYYTRTTATSDSTQTEHLTFYNYEKSYPTPLLGDLLLVHKRPSGFTGTLSLSNDIRVDGRVVIWEADASTENVRAKECLNLHKTSPHTAKNSTGTALLMPQNFAASARITSGYGGSGNPNSITDGTLNMVNNPNFPPGSVQSLMGTFSNYSGPSTGPLGQVLGLVGGVVGSIVNLNSLVPGISNPVQIQRTYLSNLRLTNLQGTSLTSLIAPLNGYAGLLNIGIVVVNDPMVPHLQFTGGMDLILVMGQLLPTGLGNTANLPPLYLWVDQSSKARHVIFIGESQRPIIFVTGTGYGQDTYVASVGVASLLGSPLQWRLHWINESTHLHIVPPLLFGSWQITGSLRTNWSVDCTDTSGNDRITFQRDTSQSSTLATMLPRDAWFEPYCLVK